ncbi:MAG: PQQ-binding-like beta-propeller repeat protein [Pyrinomonadaceae bacterium]
MNTKSLNSYGEISGGRGRRRHARAPAALFFVCALILPCPSPAEGSEDRPLLLAQPFAVRWQYETDRALHLTPAADEEMVFFPLAAGALVCLRIADGQLLWKEEGGGEFSASPTADERGVYVATEVGKNSMPSPRGGALRALGRKSGVTLWMRTLQSPIRGALAAGEKALYGGAADGRVYAFSKESGQVLCVKQFKSPFASHPVVYGGRLYIGAEDGMLYALNPETGATLWRYRTRGSLRGPVAIAEGAVYFGSADQYVYALRERDGHLRWRSRTGAEVQSVAYTPRGLLAASLDNFVYCLSTRDGERLWKRQLAGRIAAQPLAAPDGALFAPLAGDACVVLDLKDGKQLNSLPVGEGNNMAASPLASGRVLLVTTRRGLLAFAAPPPAPA